MTAQERIERDLRLFIGDLQVQILVLKAQIVEMQEAATAADEFLDKANADIKQPHKANGKRGDMTFDG